MHINVRNNPYKLSISVKLELKVFHETSELNTIFTLFVKDIIGTGKKFVVSFLRFRVDKIRFFSLKYSIGGTILFLTKKKCIDNKK